MSTNKTDKKSETESTSIKAEKALSSVAKPVSTAAKRPAVVRSSAEEVETVRPASFNNIYIGKKPVMSYAMSSLIQLTACGEIVIKARGMSISRAVDVAEIVTKRLGNNAYEIKKVEIDTVKLGEGEDIRSVSTIEIAVGKK